MIPTAFDIWEVTRHKSEPIEPIPAPRFAKKRGGELGMGVKWDKEKKVMWSLGWLGWHAANTILKKQVWMSRVGWVRVAA